MAQQGQEQEMREAMVLALALVLMVTPQEEVVED
jgi:hypothetical protein